MFDSRLSTLDPGLIVEEMLREYVTNLTASVRRLSNFFDALRGGYHVTRLLEFCSLVDIALLTAIRCVRR
jgi:hypothetical protein